MSTQASARVTLTELLDGTTANFVLVPSAAITQIKSKDPVSFLPNYAATPLVLTPNLQISGSEGSQIKQTCTWKLNGTPIAASDARFEIQTTAPYALKLKANLNAAASLISCEYIHTDPISQQSMTMLTQMTLTMVENAGTMIMAHIDPKDGLVFRTEENRIKDLRFEAVMIRGGEEDKTHVKYQWFITGADGNFKEITAATAPAGSGLPAGNLFTGAGTKTLTIKSNAVLNIASLKLICTDKDPASSTHGKTCSAVITLTDLTDPYDLYVDTPLGTAFSSRTPELPHTMIVRQGMKPVSEGFYTGKALGFYRLTAAGEKDTTWAPASSDFTGWAFNAGELRRTFSTSAGLGTAANRTVNIKRTHKLPGAQTSFSFFLDY